MCGSAGLILCVTDESDAMIIKSHGWVLPTSLTAAGFITTTMAAGGIYFKAADGSAPLLLYVFLTPFLLMGLALSFFGVRALFRLARYGTWMLSCPDEGGMIGTRFTVRLLPQRDMTPTDRIQCRLSCVQRVVFNNRPAGVSSESSANRTDVQDQNITLWNTEWSVAASAIRPGSGIEILISVPENGKPTAIDSRTGAGIRWYLNFVVPADGLSHEPMFEIPLRAH